MKLHRPGVYALLLTLPLLAGCLGNDNGDTPDPDPGTGNGATDPFHFDTPAGTTYHFDPAEANTTVSATGNNRPFAAQGTYYSIEGPTFEPTIGVTSSGAIFMTSFRGTGSGTHIFRSQDQGQTWTDVGPFLGPTQIGQFPSSNDPYLYVDPWTDRIIKFDMHGLTTMTYEFSDDDGETWSVVTPATSVTPVAQDHQSIASMPPPEGVVVGPLYPNVLVYCVNRGPQGGQVGGAYCSTSLDGGYGYTPLVPGFPVGTAQCSGLHGHLVGSSDGAIYRGNPSCDGPAAYRSLDGGFTWTEHTIDTTVGVRGHEIALGVDDDNNVHAFWIGTDGLPYYAASLDGAETWSEADMVAPPGVTETGFPTLAAGAGGRAAFSYIGTTNVDGAGEGATWNGYIGIVTDGFNATPLVTTVMVNDPTDPLDTSPNCANSRCGGFGDFIDIAIDPEGRPWAALAHNPSGVGIVGTFSMGPSLKGDLQDLPVLPLGGASDLLGP